MSINEVLGILLVIIVAGIAISLLRRLWPLALILLLVILAVLGASTLDV